MANVPTHDGDMNGRKEGHCPVCDGEYADCTRLTERIENGESEDVPGVVYDHDGDGTCFEWADGYTERTCLAPTDFVTIS